MNSQVSGTGPFDAAAGASAPSVTAPTMTTRQENHLLEPSPDALKLLPADFAQRCRVLPLSLQNGSIRVAMAAPGDPRIVDDIRLLTGLEVEEVFAKPDDILERIAASYQVTVEKMIENLNPEQGTAIEGRTLHDIEVMANEPTVINLVNLIISEAIRERASDIHLVPF